jgi:adenylate cyclase
VVPEFIAGIHAGSVTIGEIGVVKKDIAMSGEAMNLTARIRTACSELNQKQIVSQDYFDFTNLQEWQGEDLGMISLKGIEDRDVRLYSLKI